MCVEIIHESTRYILIVYIGYTRASYPLVRAQPFLVSLEAKPLLGYMCIEYGCVRRSAWIFGFDPDDCSERTISACERAASVY
jgi:hypothetical protein